MSIFYVFKFVDFTKLTTIAYVLTEDGFTGTLKFSKKIVDVHARIHNFPTFLRLFTESKNEA